MAPARPTYQRLPTPPNGLTFVDRIHTIPSAVWLLIKSLLAASLVLLVLVATVFICIGICKYSGTLLRRAIDRLDDWREERRKRKKTDDKGATKLVNHDGGSEEKGDFDDVMLHGGQDGEDDDGRGGGWII